MVCPCEFLRDGWRMAGAARGSSASVHVSITRVSLLLDVRLCACMSLFMCACVARLRCLCVERVLELVLDWCLNVCVSQQVLAGADLVLFTLVHASSCSHALRHCCPLCNHKSMIVIVATSTLPLVEAVFLAIAAMILSGCTTLDAVVKAFVSEDRVDMKGGGICCS